jgi:autotransporter-associated beta strand protein
MKKYLSVLALAVSASLAMAAFTPITGVTYTPSGGGPTVRTLTSLTTSTNGVTADVFNANGLANGTTSTTGTVPTGNGGMARMDNFDINDLATGFNNTILTTNFGGINFSNFNGSLPDFFIFEGASGANPDDISIAAVLADGSLGQSVVAPTIIATNGWGNTGEVITDGLLQNGQTVAGLCWKLEDLKDGSGNQLSSTTVIQGIAITAGFGIDPLAVLAASQPILIDHFAVTPSVTTTNVGDVFDVTITAQDAGNATVNSGSAIIAIVAAGTLMEFDWNSDGTYGDASGTLVSGTKTIKARNKRAETATLVASVGAITTTTPPTVTTTVLPFSNLLVLAPNQTHAPGTATGKAGGVVSQLQGSSFSVTVLSVDAYFNAVSSGDTVGILSSDNTATLPADAALVTGTNTYSVTFNQRGSFTVTATNVSNGLITNGVSSAIVSAVALTWKGDGSANVWETNTATLNWTNAINGLTYFNNGDQALFDDSGSATPAVNITGTVTPWFVTVNSANNYNFGSGSGGGIGGSASFNKTGSGSVTLNTSNSYSGGTRFTDGTLTLSNAFALPTTGQLALTNTTVVLAATNLTRAGNTTIRGTSVTFAAVGANRSVSFGNTSWGGTNNALFEGDGTNELVLCRIGDSFTLDFQSQIDFLSNAGDKVIRVEDGAAAVDAIMSGRLLDNAGNTGRLVKTGAGTLKMTSPTSNYEIPTYIQAGTVILTGAHDNDGVFILGDGANSGVLQVSDATTLTNLTVKSITTSGTGTGNRVVGGNASISTLTLNTTGGDVVFDGVIGGPGANQNNLALAKNQTGLVLTLTASNTYVGPTIINNGTLALSGAGSINNSVSIEVTSPDLFDVSAVTGGYVLGAAQTLKGLGSVNGSVTANGRVEPGSGGIGTLTFFSDLTLNSSAKLVMDINNTNTPNHDTLTVIGTFTPGGTLVVTNIGPALALSNSFQLFSTATTGFSTVQLPTPPSGTVWTNNLAVDGTIALVAAPVIAPSPTNITFTVSGGNLILNWPSGQGWNLQAQTNSRAVGLTTNWVTVPGAVPPLTNAVDAANGTVFYRLVYP